MPRETTHELDLALGLAIRLRRQRLGLSQTQLGGIARVSFQQIQKYERGTNRVSFSMLMRISEALGCGAADLVAEVERIRGGNPGAGVGAALVTPEASPLLMALSEIKDADVRRSLLEFTRNLARELDG